MNGAYGRFGTMSCAPCYSGVFAGYAGGEANANLALANASAGASGGQVLGGKNVASGGGGSKFNLEQAGDFLQDATGFVDQLSSMFGRKQQTPQYDLPPAEPKKSALPWVIGGGAALLLAVGVGYAILKD